MTIHIQGKTDTGCVRTENEDSIDWWFFGDNKTLCCVLADGMGGYEGGALASQLAVSCIREKMTSLSVSEFTEFEAIEKQLIDAGNDANTVIQARRNSDPLLSKMGTTLVVAVIHQQKMCVMHAGDSRCYLFRENTLSQLTRDDSVVQQMIDDGSISEQEGERTPYRNVLVKAVGVEQTLEYSLYHNKLVPGDQVMLCSDGLFNTVSPDKIAQILASPVSITDKVDSLLTLSLEMGVNDNVSIILFLVSD